MRCDLCGGRLEKKMVSYTLFYEGRWIIVEGVLAKACQQCGEKLFSPQVVERLQKIIWNKQRPQKTVETPVYSLSSL